MVELNNDVSVVEIRKRVREHLENLVVGNRLSLDDSKVVAKTANEILVKNIVSWEELTEAIKRLELQFPKLERLWKMMVFDVGLENKRIEIDNKVMPKVAEGDLDGALDLLRTMV